MYWQEEAEQGEHQEDQGAGEDRCHPSVCNRRLRATQSPKYHEHKLMCRGNRPKDKIFKRFFMAGQSEGGSFKSGREVNTETGIPNTYVIY